MNLLAASGRGIVLEYCSSIRPKGRGIKPKQIKYITDTGNYIYIR